MDINQIINLTIDQIKSNIVKSFITRIECKKCSIQDYLNVLDDLIEPNNPGSLEILRYNNKEYLIGKDYIVYDKNLVVPIGFYDVEKRILFYNEL